MLSPGTRLGAYELIGPLGTGGMGEVYRARDTRLGRDVALKVLPPHLASDPSRLARFEQEARHVASLNHPNIVAVFDFGKHGDIAYMVTELVDGTTLRAASFPVRKIVEIGAQIADALAAAHGAGVTHRDIKPDNVMVTTQGRVKLLDFGVAKVASQLAADSMTIPQTGVGSVVGTVGYMAPEQVHTGTVDSRTDIFSVGVLLYELLAGSPPFAGDTAPEIMAATLKADPPELPAKVPDGIQRIVRRCLEKNPEERFQSARDLSFALRQLTGSSLTAETAGSHSSTSRRSRAWLVAAVGFGLGVVAAGALVQRWSARQDATVDSIELMRLTADRRTELSPAFAPDGRSLASLRVAGTGTEVLVRSMGSQDPVVVARSNSTLSSPVWSSDGNQVCYTDLHRELWCVGAAGGSPRRVLEDATLPRMAPNGRDIYFIRVFQQQPWLYKSSAEGEPVRVGQTGLPTQLTTLSPVSPDGLSLVFAARSELWIVSLPDGTRRPLSSTEDVHTHSIAWLPDSQHIVIVEEMTTLIGSRIVIEDTRSRARRLVLTTADNIEGVATSADGTRIVYSGGPVERDVMEYTSEGKFLRPVAATSILEGLPAWSPKGDRFVYRAGGPGQSDSLWVGDGASPATLVQRLASNATSKTPISPDGGRIAFRDGNGIQVVSISGGRAIRVLTDADVSPGLCWSPDGDWIWFSEGPLRIGRIPSGGGQPVFIESKPAILKDCSPDLRWILRSRQNGYVLTSADGKSERPVGDPGVYDARGDNPAQFSGNGKQLYLLRQDQRTIDVLDVVSGQKLRAIAFEIPIEDQIEGFSFNPDGTRVLLTTGGDRSDLWMARGFARPTTGWKRWFTHWQPAEARPAR